MPHSNKSPAARQLHFLGDGMSHLITNNQERAVRTLGISLALGDTDTWLGTAVVLKARLTDRKLASLAFAALRAQAPELAVLTVEAALCRAGAPLPPLISAMDEAAFWADFASIAEIKAYALASYNRMPKPDQRAFLSYLQRGIAA